MQSASEYVKSDDTRLAALAARQEGVVGIRQLRALGFSDPMIHARVAKGRLHRWYRGVYAVGHTKISVRGRWMAAVIACGSNAVLSHRAAAALWDLRTVPAGPIDVTATSRRSPRGIRCHFARNLHPEDCTERGGIPVTTLSRLLLDIAETRRPRELRATLEAAQRRDLLNLMALEELIARNRGRHGIKSLRQALVALHDEPPWTQSELEREFLELVREAGLPEPRTNVIVDGELVDAYWPEHNLIAEIDGWEFHKTKRSFEDDRRKDAKLLIARRRVVRFTATRVFHQRHGVAGDLGALLGEP